MEAETKVSEVKDNHVTTYKIKPTDFGIKMATLNDIKGGTPEENKEIILKILKGEEQGPKRDVVLLNAGTALYVAGKADSIQNGIDIAKDSIDSGKALEKLNQLKDWTNKNK